MSKDYKNRIPAYQQRRQLRKRQMVMVASLASFLAVIGGSGVYYLVQKEEREVQVAVSKEEINKGQIIKETESPESAKIEGRQDAGKSPVKGISNARFSFYKVLPEEGAIIPENEIKTLKRTEKQGKKPESLYLVQVGSFSRREEAEVLMDQLSAINVKPKLEMIRLDSDSWFRVKLGPYATLADADKVRTHLRANEIDSVVQKMKTVP